MAQGWRVGLLVGLALGAAGGTLLLPPIPQDPAYHAFADRRRLLGVPNLLNVLSNAGFLLVGALGFRRVLGARAGEEGPLALPGERLPWLVLFASVALTGLGSAVYHWAPANATLVWDRLPLACVLMALLAITITERISLHAGRRLLPPLLALGAASVGYWYWGELRGMGDLRPYGLVQFFPILAIPLTLVLFPSRYAGATGLLGALGWYLLGRIFELLDREVYALGGLVSGHTLKHLAAALAVYEILRMLRKRRPLRRSRGPEGPS